MEISPGKIHEKEIERAESIVPLGRIFTKYFIKFCFCQVNGISLLFSLLWFFMIDLFIIFILLFRLLVVSMWSVAKWIIKRY